MRPCHNYFLSFHIQNKVFHFTPLTQYIIVSRPKARTARTESLDRFWTRPKIFFAQCFRGSRENPG